MAFDFPVDVGSRRMAGQTHDAEDLASVDDLAGADPAHRLEVCIDGLVAVGVTHDDDEGAPAGIPWIATDVGDEAIS